MLYYGTLYNHGVFEAEERGQMSFPALHKPLSFRSLPSDLPRNIQSFSNHTALRIALNHTVGSPKLDGFAERMRRNFTEAAKKAGSYEELLERKRIIQELIRHLEH